MAGVMCIDQLIVKSDKHRQGVGRSLMDQIECLAHKNNIHKIYLMTGADWKSVGFYEYLGYKKEAKLNNLYEHKDFWVMTKDLN
jgi:N-acetylglutamate synthase-like GNAT family acetyltransferase